MLLCPKAKCLVDNSSRMAILINLRGSQPGVYHQACAGIQLVWLSRRIDIVDDVEQGSRRDLRRLLGSGIAISRGAHERARRHHRVPVAHVGQVGGSRLPSWCCGWFSPGSEALVPFALSFQRRAVSLSSFHGSLARMRMLVG